MINVPNDLGKDPEPATIYARFTVYGRTFVYEQSFPYVPTALEGIDSRVLDFFRNAYAEARLEERTRRFTEFEKLRLLEIEEKERKILKELQKKYAG